MKFSEYHINEDIKYNLDKLGFKKPTDIQFKSIPAILRGEDVLAIAQTGTGKTAAFALPILNRLMNDRSAKALVIAPTRELAQQIEAEFRSIANRIKRRQSY